MAFDLGNKTFQHEVGFHKGVHQLQNPYDAERPFFWYLMFHIALKIYVITYWTKHLLSQKIPL